MTPLCVFCVLCGKCSGTLKGGEFLSLTKVSVFVSSSLNTTGFPKMDVGGLEEEEAVALFNNTKAFVQDEEDVILGSSSVWSCGFRA